MYDHNLIGKVQVKYLIMGVNKSPDTLQEKITKHSMDLDLSGHALATC